MKDKNNKINYIALALFVICFLSLVFFGSCNCGPKVRAESLEESTINETKSTELAEKFDVYAQSAITTIIGLLVGSGTGMLIITAFKSYLKKKKEEAKKETELLRQERLALKEENDKKESQLREKMDKVIGTDEKTTELSTTFQVGLKELFNKFKEFEEKFNGLEAKNNTTLEILKYISSNNVELVVNGKASTIAKVINNEERKEEKTD